VWPSSAHVHLRVHLRHERARGVDRPQPPRRRTLVHHGRNAVSRQNERRPLRRFLLALDEDRAARLELANDMDVVDDLLADVHRRAVQLQRLLDRLDGPLDTGAVPAGRRERTRLTKPARRIDAVP